MPGCSIQRELEGARTVIRLSGTFDRASAHELTQRLEGEPGKDELVLDFSLVREFADLGVATLAHGLAGAERRLLLRGLRQHQLRIFRYFGVDVDDLKPLDDHLEPLDDLEHARLGLEPQGALGRS